MKVKIYSGFLVLAFLSVVSSSLAQCEPDCGGEIVTHHPIGSIAPETVDITYETVEYDSLCWITQNLGATQQADSATDPGDAAAGWYWQFNRKQGYKWNSENSTFTPDASWISSIDESSDWLAENDPCSLLLGAGWRITTNDEWVSASGYTSWVNYNDAFSDLMLHTAGYYTYSSRTCVARGVYCSYYSSTEATNIEYGRVVVIKEYIISFKSWLKENAQSVRCCKSL